MGSKVHEFKVEMTCDGCSKAVEKVLSKLKGIDDVKISVSDKSVKVTSSLPAEEILSTIQKTGKETMYIGVES